MPGLLGDDYLRIASQIDSLGFWPEDLTGLRVADVGCFSGGLTLIIAGRGAEHTFAVDEIPEHIEQCRLVMEAFRVKSVEPIEAGLYRLPGLIEPGTLDLILLSGVLYHLSDMLCGMIRLQELLKPSGVLIVETNAVNCFEHSYANFGRFASGIWWQPTALLLQDLCTFSGFTPPDISFYRQDRCLMRTTRSENAEVPFRRGMPFIYGDIHDQKPRSLDLSVMRPAPCSHVNNG
jgi:SAM-dependent methyltransferase